MPQALHRELSNRKVALKNVANGAMVSRRLRTHEVHGSSLNAHASLSLSHVLATLYLQPHFQARFIPGMEQARIEHTFVWVANCVLSVLKSSNGP